MEKNLLFVFVAFPGIGGVERVSDNLIEYLAEEYTVYALSFMGADDVPASSRLAGIFHFEGWDEEANIRFFNSLVKEKRITHIINQGMYPETSRIVFNRDRDTRVKVVSTLHGMPGYEKKQYWQEIRRKGKWEVRKRRLLACLGLYKPYARYVRRYREAALASCEEGGKVVLLCQEYVAPFLQLYGLERYSAKVCAIENPLPASLSLQDPGRWDEKENLAVFVGRLSPEKRVELVLQAWKLLGDTGGWKLDIVGDGPERGKLEQLARDWGLADVTFTGQTLCPEQYYRSAKVILLASRFEGFPMCLIEALHFGTVPVAFAASRGVESIVGGSGGVVVPNGDVRALAGALGNLLADETRLKAASQSAMGKSSRYLPGNIVGQWLDLLAEL